MGLQPVQADSHPHMVAYCGGNKPGLSQLESLTQEFFPTMTMFFPVFKKEQFVQNCNRMFLSYSSNLAPLILISLKQI